MICVFFHPIYEFSEQLQQHILITRLGCLFKRGTNKRHLRVPGLQAVSLFLKAKVFAQGKELWNYIQNQWKFLDSSLPLHMHINRSLSLLEGPDLTFSVGATILFLLKQPQQKSCIYIWIFPGSVLFPLTLDPRTWLLQQKISGDQHNHIDAKC